MNRPQFLPRSSKDVAKNVANISYYNCLRSVLKNMGRRCIAVGVFNKISKIHKINKENHRKYEEISKNATQIG